MKVLLCQSSFKVGDIQYNKKKILQITKKNKCDLIVFPELSLVGYPPEDLLELPFFVKNILSAQKSLVGQVSQAILFGGLNQKKQELFNSAVILNQKKLRFFHKSALAVSDTFDESRFFSKGDIKKKIWKYKNKKILILICEDLWKLSSFPSKKEVDYIICINASPYFPQQRVNRLKLAQKICRKLDAPFVYLNLVGAHDEWVFDGASFVLDRSGKTKVQMSEFKEDLQMVDLDKIEPKKQVYTSGIQQKKEAIVLGIKNFVFNNKIKRVHLGLSGGLDSALVACLCQEALGKNKIKAHFLDGPFTKKDSFSFAKKLCQILKIPLVKDSIIPSYDFLLGQLKKLSPVARENLQARLRMVFLMALSNSSSSFLIGTGNKSELAMGYSTLYGDLSGSFCPIGDLYKSEVREMAKVCYPSKTMNQILKREPSAELAKDQIDKQTLPPYEKLDPILKGIIEDKKAPQSALEKDIFSKLIHHEFKRRQAPLILKVSSKSFGRGRRYPISSGISD